MSGPGKKLRDIYPTISRQNREDQEGFLRRQGWEQLKDGLDIWCNPSRPGADAHDIHRFDSALLVACREIAFGPRPLTVHHHPGTGL